MSRSEDRTVAKRDDQAPQFTPTTVISRSKTEGTVNGSIKVRPMVDCPGRRGAVSPHRGVGSDVARRRRCAIRSAALSCVRWISSHDRSSGRLMFIWLLALVPGSWVFAYATGQQSLWTFGMATAAIVPLAEWIRRAAEQLARRSGPAVGGLLTVSIGNTAELVMMLSVLRRATPTSSRARSQARLSATACSASASRSSLAVSAA